MDQRHAAPSFLSSGVTDVNALLRYAVACHQSGLLSEAEKAYRRILKRQPKQFDALHLLGLIHFQNGAYPEALRHIDGALKIDPRCADAHGNRAAVLRALKRLQEALASCDRAIELDPGHADAFSTRAAVLLELRRFPEALESSERAIALKPADALAHSNRGVALRDLKRREEALASCERAIALNPNFADAHNNRANLLNQLDRYDEAYASALRAVALNPDLAEAHLNLGSACLGLKRHGEAVESYGRALALDPDLAHLWGSYLHAKLVACDWKDFEGQRARLAQAIACGRLAASPFQLHVWSPDAALQLKSATSVAGAYYDARPEPLWRGEIYSHERIRIAYLSADFTDHPVSYQAIGLFERHDRTRFETTAISYAPDAPSPIRKRLKAAFDRFVDARDKTDQEVAALLRGLEIDIAVDLNGFTDGMRPDVLSHRPAPVHVNYLGYPGTLGSDWWDYIIADPVVIPAGSEGHYREKIVRLPHSFMPNDSGRLISPRTPSRAEAGLPDNALVYCCFNASYKILPEMFDVWMRLLGQVANSVLWLAAANAAAVANLRREAAVRGTPSDRLVFAPKVPLNEDHLARLRLADLFLDTLYYNAHSTAADALWAGVPVVTCAGETFASRVAASQLHAVGLPELITGSLAEYEALALRLAREPAQLLNVRNKLARNRESFPLFDTACFTRHLEAAYVTMWERTQRGEPPESFDVPSAD